MEVCASVSSARYRGA